MADLRPSLISRIETALRGWVHTDDPTLGSGRFDLGTLNGMLATRALALALYFDGITASSRGYASLGTAADGIGAGKLTKLDIIEVPSANPSAARGIWVLGPGASTYDSPSASWSLSAYWNTSGGLVVMINSGDPNYYSRSLTVAGVVAALPGAMVPLGITWDGASAPVITLNGIVQTTSESSSGGGSAPAWTQAVSDDYLLLGRKGLSEYFRGRIVPGPLINAVLTPAQLLTWAQTGFLPSWCKLGTGSMVSFYTSNFASGVDSFSQNIGDADLVLTGNVDAISGIDDVLQVEAVGAVATLGISKANILAVAGKAWRITFDYYVETGSGMAYFGPYVGASSDGLRGSRQAIVEGSWQTGSFEAVYNTTQLRIFSSTAATGDQADDPLVTGKKCYFKNIRAYPLGPIAEWVIQPGCSLLTDSGDNRTPLLCAAGVTALGPKPEVIALPSQVISADAFLLADQAVVPAGYEVFACVLSMLTGTSTGTVTVRKTSSGGSTLFTGILPGAAGLLVLTATPTLFATADKIHIACSSYAGSTTFTIRPLARRIY